MANLGDGRRSLALLPNCLVLLFLLLLSQGCARQGALPPSGAKSAVTPQKLPFHGELQTASVRSSDHAAASSEQQSSDQKLKDAIPFENGSRQINLPAGTLLTVQLGSSLSATKVHPGDKFTATVAAPLSVDGETLVERGTAVTGRIESAQFDGDRTPAVGYLRLTLDAMTVGGKPVPLQTSSLFARAQQGSSADFVRVQKGRRLTFRMLAPVQFDDPNLYANRQYAGSN